MSRSHREAAVSTVQVPGSERNKSAPGLRKSDLKPRMPTEDPHTSHTWQRTKLSFMSWSETPKRRTRDGCIVVLTPGCNKQPCPTPSCDPPDDSKDLSGCLRYLSIDQGWRHPERGYPPRTWPGNQECSRMLAGGWMLGPRAEQWAPGKQAWL